ncbi:hypothetical protein [Natronorubrum sp. DTA7]
MATSQSATHDYRCPECTGSLQSHHDSLECVDCGYTPRHGSD